MFILKLQQYKRKNIGKAGTPVKYTTPLNSTSYFH